MINRYKIKTKVKKFKAPNLDKLSERKGWRLEYDVTWKKRLERLQP